MNIFASHQSTNKKSSAYWSKNNTLLSWIIVGTILCATHATVHAVTHESRGLRVEQIQSQLPKKNRPRKHIDSSKIEAEKKAKKP